MQKNGEFPQKRRLHVPRGGIEGQCRQTSLPKADGEGEVSNEVAGGQVHALNSSIVRGKICGTHSRRRETLPGLFAFFG
jgi:hypothetical protein